MLSWQLYLALQGHYIKMRRSILIGIVAVLLVCTQKGYTQTPRELSDRIVSSTDSLYLLASVWGNKFIDNLNGAQHYEELTPLRKDLQDFINDQLALFTNMNDVSGSGKMRAAVIALYGYEKTLVELGFMPFEKLTPNSSDDQVNECRSRLKEEAGKERDYLTAVNTERREFAKVNGFSIAPPVVAKPVPRAIAPPPPPRKMRPDAPAAAFP